MNTTIEQIKPETLAILEKQAKIFGLSVDEYLQNILPKTEKELPVKNGDDFETDMITFAEDTEKNSSYNGTYSREDIYLDYKVIGVQVHDTKLIASMNVHKVKYLVTLNEKNLKRFSIEVRSKAKWKKRPRLF